MVLSSCLTSCAKFTVREDPDVGDGGSHLADFNAQLEIPSLTTVVQGRTTKVPIKIHRDPNNTGSGIMSVTGLPNGIQADSVTIPESADPSQVQEIELSLVADMPATGTVYPTPILVVGHTSESTLTLRAGLPMVVRGKPGTLDTAFADGGVYEDPSEKYYSINAVTPHLDGVVIGATLYPPESSTIIRLSADGSLDTTFAEPQFPVQVQDIAPDDAGHILTVGTAPDNSASIVNRFTKAGNPDISFTPTSSVTLPTPDGWSNYYPSVITVAPNNGYIYVGAGAISINGIGGYSYAFAQISPTGDIATNTAVSIGSGCYKSWGPSSYSNYLTNLFVLPSGALTFAGWDGSGIGVGRFLPASPSSSLCQFDTRYGGVGGTFGESYFMGTGYLDDSVLEDDGSFVLLGHNLPSHGVSERPYSLLRVDPAGMQVTQSDTSLMFSSQRNWAGYIAGGVMRMPDGHYLVTGESSLATASSMAIAFYNSDLTLDTSMGTNGVTLIPTTIANTFGVGLRAIPSSDGQYTLVVGVAHRTDANIEHLVVARLQN